MHKLPKLTDAQKAAFRGEFDEDTCAQWGARTRSAAVQIDAERWVVAIFFTLERLPEVRSFYSLERLTWFVECLMNLAAQRQHDTGTARARGGRSELDRTALLARMQRDELLGPLQRASMTDPMAMMELAGARGKASDEPPAVHKTLAGLVALAQKWLAKPALAKILERDGVTAETVETARLDAEALQEQLALDAPLPLSDSKSTDAIEGRVLLEMRFARKAFNQALATIPTVPVLSPGAGTKGVLND